MIIILNHTSEIKNEIIAPEEHAHYLPTTLEVKLGLDESLQESDESQKLLNRIYCSLEENGYEVLEEERDGMGRRLLLSCVDGLTCFEKIQDMEYALSSNEIDIMNDLNKCISVPFELTICYFGVH